MKHITLPFLLSVLIFTSCDNSAKKETSSTIDSSNLMVVPDGDPYQEAGEQLMKEEVIGQLRIGDNNFFALKILGEPTSESDPVLWESDGANHITATYSNGVILDMIEKDTLEYLINSISVQAPSDFETSKGIKIGSSLSDVLKAYNQYIGKPLKDSSIIVAGSIYGGLVFGIENRKVSKIYLGASAE